VLWTCLDGGIGAVWLGNSRETEEKWFDSRQRQENFILESVRIVGRDSVVRIAIWYWLDCPGIECGGRDFPHPSRLPLGITQTLAQWVQASYMKTVFRPPCILCFVRFVKTSNVYVCKQLQLIDLYNGDGMCLLRGRSEFLNISFLKFVLQRHKTKIV